MNHDASQTELLRQLQQANPPTLWLVDDNLPIAELAPSLTGKGDQLLALTHRFDVHQALTAAGIHTQLNDYDFTELGEFASIIYRVSKEKALVHHCINQSLQHLTDTGQLVLVGNKTDGIKSIAKNTANAYGLNSHTKKQGTSYFASFNKPTDTSPKLTADDYARLRLIDNPTLPFYSKPGIFGWDKIDKGSQLLIDVLNEQADSLQQVKRVLDLGCGWGFLLLATRQWPLNYRCGTDSNCAAINAARKNLDYYNVTAELSVDDCGAQLTKPFDLILCNPPFHHGFSVNQTLISRFLQRASDLMHNHSQAYFVVNEFIPLERNTQGLFEQVDLLAHENGFKVFRLIP